MKITMRPRIILQLILLGIIISSHAQTFKNAIIEVYIDNDTIETFNYSIQIISKKDILTPKILDKYFIPKLKLDTFVTVCINYQNKKIIIHHVEDLFLSHWSYIKINISSQASDNCIQETFMVADMTNIGEPECILFHTALFEKFSILDYEAFYKKWLTTKIITRK
jgi:hypothetical protein